jgi:hypothetical protein
MPFYIQCLQPDQPPGPLATRDAVFVKVKFPTYKAAEAMVAEAEREAEKYSEQSLSSEGDPIVVPKPAFRIVEAGSLADAMVKILGWPSWPPTMQPPAEPGSLEATICPVCGFAPLLEEPWPENRPSYEICPCCGTEFGNEDFSLDPRKRATRHRDLREQWMSGGMNWWSTNRLPPHDWNPLAQLRSLDDGQLR